ncbi:HET-domain-containing protein [Lentithecium fluviatile CBS 122367]|uniref:HET-domain-containing protein n=1 Tax=Lentithecium fluviatile CBS 122367 TaxID=1168545 RepID=A0A6G1IJ52_9PLEO|nr:HET-domain-containing protein [Lentithecium fluviatile CBS 122367]
MANIYTALGEGYIRLLRLEPASPDVKCRLDIFPLSEAPDYFALSYTWGPPYAAYDQAGKEIPCRDGEETFGPPETSRRVFCNGEEISVMSNLLDFLLHCSGHADPTFQGYWWIDAICINQIDLPERSHQVNLMAEIYKAASRVVIWLGVAEDDTLSAFELIDTLASMPLAERLHLSQRSANLPKIEYWVALARLFERTWFNRAWVIQEVTFARELTVLCGSHRLAWDRLTVVSQFLATSIWTNFFKSSEFLQSSNGAARWHNTPARLAATRRTYSSASSDGLLYALIRGRPSVCQDPRDKVYSQLGLGHANIFPSYKVTVAEAYITTAKYILEHTDNLLLLTCVEGEEFQRIQGLPSWVPDWSVTEFLGLRVTGYGSFTASGERPRKFSVAVEEGKHILSVEATRVDEIVEIGETKTEVRQFTHPEKLWNLISKLPEQYHTGQSREEVVWRVLMTNRESAAKVTSISYPASKSLEPSFRDWILWRYSVASMNPQNTPATAYPACTSKAGVLPSKEDVLVAVNMSRQDSDFLKDLAHCASLFDVHYSHAMLQRPFRTKQGFFGIATQALRENDGVWVVPGCRVPLIFRKIECSTRYRLIGGSYLHGFMEGEALNCSAKFEIVELE